METTGLSFGKYFPMHVGHEYYLKEAAKLVDRLIICVCANKSQKFMGITNDDRHIAMIRFVENNIPNAEVHFLDDQYLPAGPSLEMTSDEVSREWAVQFGMMFPSVTHVITSESYGDEVAKYMGVEHICVDVDRKTFPVSATMIRNDVIKNWHLMNEYMQMKCTFKICVTGPESCGKTTISKKLAELFDGQFIPEHARMILNHMNLNDEIFEDIAIGQYSRVFEAPPEKFVQVCDTDLIVTQLFAEWYLGGSVALVNKLQTREKYDFYVVLAPTIPWCSDGLRNISEQEHRNYLFNRILSLIRTTETPFVIINDTDYDQRFNNTVKAVGTQLFNKGLESL